MKNWKPSVAVVLFLLLGGCEREIEESAKEPPGVELPVVMEPEGEFEGQEEEEPEAAPEGLGPDPIWLSTWPGREEHTTVAVMWLGGDEEQPLYKQPDQGSQEIGRFGFEDGADLEWTQSKVYVEKPRELRVLEETEWVGIPFDAEYRELEAEARSFVLEEEERIYLYQYEGEGSCFLGVQGEVALGDCPGGGGIAVSEEPEEGGQSWRPDVQYWWLEIRMGSVEGWLLVDEAPVDVRIVDLSDGGYDSIYGKDEF